MIPSKLIEFRIMVDNIEHQTIRRYVINTTDAEIEEDFQDWCSNFIAAEWKVIAE